MKFLKINNSGVILVLVTLITAAIILLSGYFMEFVITETKISKSQALSAKTYYLTEAGIRHALWKIKNDANWLNNFQTNPVWQTTLVENNPFGNGGSYNVLVQNNELGHAEVTALGDDTLGNNQSQRQVKTLVFQAQGTTPSSSIALFTDSDLIFSGTNFGVTNGGIFANDDVILNLFSEIDVEGKTSAVDQINVTWGSTLNDEAHESANYPPAPESLAMPQVDFDSPQPTSYKNQADHVYNSGQFGNLMNNNSNLTLNGIIYVTGNINIPRGVHLTINGILLSDGNVSLGSDWWPFWKSGGAITVNDPGSGPVGLLSKRSITFGSYVEDVAIDGVIYATDELTLNAYGADFSLSGALIGRSLVFNSLWELLSLAGNNDLVIRTLGASLTLGSIAAPIINIEHWEEEY